MRYLLFSPSAHQVRGPGRLVLASRGIELLVREFGNADQVFKIDLNSLPYQGNELTFKCQARVEGKWRAEVTGLLQVPERPILGINATRIPIVDPQLLLRSGKLDSEHLTEVLAACRDDVRARRDLSRALGRFMAKVWSDDHGPDERVLEFCKILEESSSRGGGIPFLENVAFYLRQYIILAGDFARLGIRSFNYLDIVEYRKSTPELSAALAARLAECEARSDLEAARLFAGMVHSFAGDRTRAADQFSRACEGGAEFINTFALDLGAHTYGSGVSTPDDPGLVFHDPARPVKAGVLVLISVDENFLRRYGPYLFWISHILEGTAFHFHLIAPLGRQEEVVADAKKLYVDIARFFGGALSNPPSYSSSMVPDSVASPKTYYACGRYMVADRLMDHFGCDLYIMDADLFLEREMEGYLREISRFDVSLPVSRGLRALPPWRRFQAGNVYIKNSPGGRKFLSHVQEYMNAYFHVEKSWMLDQNALAYAVEECGDEATIGSYSMIKVKRPTFQLDLAGNIEKKK